MIISHRYKYLFIEIPDTASTSISMELREFYSGEPILRKHANYFEFQKIASNREKQYFVFTVLRNPLDRVINSYLRYLHNQGFWQYKTKRDYLLNNIDVISKRQIKIFNYVQKKDINFEDYIRKVFYHSFPFVGMINLCKPYCNFIIRFERINEGFSHVLKLLEIPQIRPLPHQNPTLNKENDSSYYNECSIDYFIKIFGPFMLEWKYKFPKSWSSKKIHNIDMLKYNFAKHFSLYYAKLTTVGFLKKFKLIRDVLGF